jgi:hypothetical protein
MMAPASRPRVAVAFRRQKPAAAPAAAGSSRKQATRSRNGWGSISIRASGDRRGRSSPSPSRTSSRSQDYEARLGKPFAQESFVRELADLRDQLKLMLSEYPPEGSKPVAELAERIKALREANTVEAAPKRTGARKAVRAERPVTARIRARLSEQAMEEAEEPTQSPVEVKTELVEPPAPWNQW